MSTIIGKLGENPAPISNLLSQTTSISGALLLTSLDVSVLLIGKNIPTRSRTISAGLFRYTC